MCMPRSERLSRWGLSAGAGALVWICLICAAVPAPIHAAEVLSCQKDRAGSVCDDEQRNREESAPVTQPLLSMTRDSDGNVRRQLKLEADLMVRDRGRIGIVVGETSVDNLLGFSP